MPHSPLGLLFLLGCCLMSAAALACVLNFLLEKPPEHVFWEEFLLPFWIRLLFFSGYLLATSALLLILGPA